MGTGPCPSHREGGGLYEDGLQQSRSVRWRKEKRPEILVLPFQMPLGSRVSHLAFPGLECVHLFPYFCGC